MVANAAGTSTHLTLLERVRTLDPQGWIDFVRLYDSLFSAYIANCSQRYQLGFNEHDREDIKQDVLIKLYRTLPTFQLDRTARGRFRTWLWQVVHNAAIDWVRHNRRRLRPQVREANADGAASPDPQQPAPLALVFTPELPDLAAENTPPADEQAIQDHLWDVRRHILERVAAEMQSAQKWECFDRHFLQGRRSADVAAELGLSVSAVNTYTSRVLARIRALSQYYEVEL